MMGLDETKPVFGVSDKGRLKLVWKIENFLVSSLDMILSNKLLTKALIRLRGCAGWSAPLLFTNTEDRFFTHRGHDNHSIMNSVYTDLGHVSIISTLGIRQG